MGTNDNNQIRLALAVVDGPFAPPQELKDKVLLLDDGTLHVADTYRNEHAVATYWNLLRNGFKPSTGHALRRAFATFDQLQALRDTHKEAAVIQRGSNSQDEVKSILRDAVERRASDVHFVNGEKTTRVRFRIDGRLVDVDEMLVGDGVRICSTMYTTMTDISESDYRENASQDGRIARKWVQEFGLNGSRIATRPMESHNLFVLRLMYPGALGGLSLEGLGYEKDQIFEYKRMMRRDGVNILSGVTGSGKSTTLKIICDMLLGMYEGEINLLTLEDPPEFVIPGAVQTPVKVKDGASVDPTAWAQAIANAMRLDPDFMMVGELRDRASVMGAVHASMTGHGLWTTIHAKNALATLDRLLHLDVPKQLLCDASLITGLVNQSLVPLLCTQEGCSTDFHTALKQGAVDEEVAERVQKYCDVSKVRIRSRANLACPICGGLGIHRRTVAAEVMTPTQKLLNVYQDQGSSAARSYWVREMQGMTSLAHMVSKVNKGIVDPVIGEEAMRRGLDEDELTLA
ncbi:GspE/PulE family protein [Pandoraea communis]|uniref:GspE/PulE family protein n=1 Tax=Pandoraea communis TaxID=2508297 RepID=UPI0025A59D25|nr:ATPase, T2SS/T4P/T4SS family [Pandoraea communis]MDM8356529.1 ATPase, T2SS/T4P/T4SS family [Pandoraea communis]